MIEEMIIAGGSAALLGGAYYWYKDLFRAARRQPVRAAVQFEIVHRWVVTFRIPLGDYPRVKASVLLGHIYAANTNPPPPTAAPEAEVMLRVSTVRQDQAEAYVQRQLGRLGVSCLAMKSRRA